MSKKKLVIISPFQKLLFRGIESFVNSLANNLASKYNYNVVIYTWNSTGSAKIEKKWADNITIRSVPYFKYYRRYIAVFFYRLWLMIDRPSKIIINFLYHGEEYLPTNKSYVYVLNSPAHLIPGRYAYIKNKIKKFKNISFVCVSKHVEDGSKKFMPNIQSSVIYNGVNTKFFVPKKKLRSTNILNLISLSALEERKGIQHIIKALALMKDKSIKYNIYGDGDFKNEIISLINENNLDDQVHLHASTNRVKEKLQESDVFCLTSIGEAFAIAPLEAMSCGLPIIVSNAPPYDEFMNDDMGAMVNIESIESIVNAIKSMKDPLKREKLGNSARKFIEENFDWEKIADLYHNTLSID